MSGQKIIQGMLEALDHAMAARVAAEAYQVIGSLAHEAGMFEHPDVQRALDYFSGDNLDGSILPFAIKSGPRP